VAIIAYTWIEERGIAGIVDTIRWSNLGAGDTGVPFLGLCAMADKTVQLIGTLGTFALQGTNAELSENIWVTVVNEAHTLIDETGGPRLETILHNPRYIRPLCGGGASGVSVIITGRRWQGSYS
jgi:hypothetical protein